MSKASLLTRCPAIAHLLALTLLAMLPPLAEASPFRLPPILSSNMVIQRGRPATFWGAGAPGTTVRLEPEWGASAISTTVHSDGSWRLTFMPPSAPGPYTLRMVAADTVVNLTNVLVGEVWLCAGQSNMEMPLAGWPPGSPVAGSDSTIAAAKRQTLRLFMVKRNFSTTPESDFTGVWLECSPLTAGFFSATGFFFGSALQHALGVPVGLVQSAWGGTPVEAWTSATGLSAFPEFNAPVRALAVARDSLAVRDRWLQQFRKITIDQAVPGKRWEDVTLDDAACARADLDDRAWRDITVPGDWEDRGLGAFDGIVWYRRSITIPREWVGKALTLRLGPIDDMDSTYVNGTLVGSTMGLDHWREPRAYAVPASLVRDTQLSIAVRVVDFVGGGGLWGNGQSVDLYADDPAQAVSLAGPWKLLPVAEYFEPTLFVYGANPGVFASRPNVPISLHAGAPTVLYKGMIAPLTSLSIRGAIWYQGEENVARPEAYARLFPAMIADWRRVFGQRDLPFYFAQIAPFDYGPRVPSALLREAQFKSLSVPNTGMAVTLDVGDAKDIHPKHKREVGERLAAWALAKTYGQPVPYSGPIYRAMQRKSGRLVLSFDAIEEGLVLRPGPGGTSFEIAGADGRFVPADARVEGPTIVLSSAAVPSPMAARYAFSNTPDATLFNSAGLPAGSFRTDAPGARH